jgi:hypothetical protein
MKYFIYSEHLVKQYRENRLRTFRQSTDSILIEHSIVYAEEVAREIIKWAQNDNYSYTRTLIRYQVKNMPSKWQPTAPDYMPGLEPNWHLMRSFVTDSNQYLKAIKMTPYNESKNSSYHKAAIEINQITNSLDSEKINTAIFWDDNPNTMVSKGHLNYFIHKYTPGAHWIRICCDLLELKKSDVQLSSRILSILSIAEYEAFRNTWYGKYRYEAVRPETYIHRTINPNFAPLIETPPFPEYPGGHSCVSATMSQIIQKMMPSVKEFTDSTQNYLGLQPRTYTSLQAAADEASISRFYGGIHYMFTCKASSQYGTKIAHIIINKFNL